MTMGTIIQSAVESSGSHLADELASVAESLLRVTVQVRDHRRGIGSGVIWRRDGLIVTNAHVARGSSAVVELRDGRTFDARVTSRDPQRDLATLTIDADELPTAPLGDPRTLRPGHLVVAAGHPLGVAGALSLGIVHAVERDGGAGTPHWIRADVRLAPGNSGGPLADVSGRVLGINTMIVGGLGLAVPSTTVTRFVETGATRPRLGIIARPVVLQRERDGGIALALLVLEVAPHSSAERAGLLVGDLITGVDGHSFRHPTELLTALSDARAGATLRLDLLRGGGALILDVAVGDESSSGARAA
jgi:serine protease Do